MTNFMGSIYKKSKKNTKIVILSEGNDERIIEAAVIMTQMDFAKIKMIVFFDEINCVKEFFELRKVRGVISEEA